MRWIRPIPSGRGFDAGLTADDERDNIVSRIVKYVPSEVIATYTMLFTAGVGMVGARPWVAVVLMLLFLGITVAYILTKSPAGSSRTAHLIVSPLAFVAWAYPISSAMLDTLFVPLVAFFLQVAVIALSIFVVPRTS